MRNIVIFGLLAVMLQAGCSKDATIKPKDYPFVITRDADVTEDGATFYADIIDPGKFEIIKYGFIWMKFTEEGLLLYSRELEFPGSPTAGVYSIKINAGLTQNQEYFIRAFVETDSCTVYGNTISFVSRGCPAPQITGFSPSAGPIGTIVEMTGSNFSPYVKDNYVSIGVKTLIVEEAYENRLIIKIPVVNGAIQGPISVLTAGMTVTTQQSFQIIYP